jgi:hypothetical protein
MDAFFRFSDERFLIHHAVNWIPGAEYLLGKGIMARDSEISGYSPEAANDHARREFTVGNYRAAKIHTTES